LKNIASSYLDNKDYSYKLENHMSNQLVTNEELILSNMLEIQALIKILIRKGITTED
jgi:hypothetical protein